MPRNLSLEGNWEHLLIPSQKLQMGDLVFLKRKGSNRLVTHVAMALGPGQLFHCCWQKKGAVIEKVRTVFSRFRQPPDSRAMLSYVDPGYQEREYLKPFSDT